MQLASRGHPLVGLAVGILFNSTGLLSHEDVRSDVLNGDFVGLQESVLVLVGLVVANIVLVPIGALIGDWLERRNSSEIRPSYARQLAGNLLGANAASRNGYNVKLDHLAKTITAIAPLLTFLASVLAAWLTYLGTRAAPGK